MPFTVRSGDLQSYNNDSEHWQEVYEGLIFPAVEKAGYSCQRDDEDLTTRFIIENIWKKIESADLVLCDLSANNPNVMLELGWALRADKRFVLVKDDVTKFNFDLNQFYTFEYSSKLLPRSLREQTDQLADVITKTMNDTQKKYSIVSKLSLSASAIEAANEGNIEVNLLNQLITDVRELQGHSPARTFASSSPMAGRSNVDIYYHDTGLTCVDASNLAETFDKHGIVSRVLPHRDPNAPDSVFFGALVTATDARLVLNALPYEVAYIFPPDYSDEEGGDSTGHKIGIGYISSHNKVGRGSRSEPVAVSASQIAKLVRPGLSNVEFQRILRSLTKF